jgi:hypothetical protein
MSETTSASPQLQPAGLDGWLVPTILVTLIWPFIYGKAIGRILEIMNGLGFARAETSMKTFALVELGMNCVLMCAWGYAAFLMFKKKRLFPVVFSILCFVAAGAAFADLIISSRSFAIPLKAEDMQALPFSLLICLLLVPYILRSRRVSNTFIN